MNPLGLSIMKRIAGGVDHHHLGWQSVKIGGGPVQGAYVVRVKNKYHLYFTPNDPEYTVQPVSKVEIVTD